MNNKTITAFQILALTIGVASLSACNDTRDTAFRATSHNQQPAKNEYLLQKQARLDEEMLIAELRVDTRNVRAMFELAKLRDQLGKQRLARNGYRQVIAAETPNTGHYQWMKTYAQARLDELKEPSQAKQMLSANSYRF